MLASVCRASAIKSLDPKSLISSSSSYYNLVSRRFKSDDAVEEEARPHTNALMAILQDPSAHKERGLSPTNSSEWLPAASAGEQIGLSARNQRRVTKAVRRARAVCILSPTATSTNLPMKETRHIF
ncbi:hypothetical protein CPC16_007532 [Podila verticillata]|nr:hypothetical protein CPC16_007532 [Podila verticillata]